MRLKLCFGSQKPILTIVIKVMKVDIIKEFKVKGEYVTLSQFLKEESIISSGGQAKWYLQDNPVLFNGAKENRRGKKIRPGDQIEVDHEIYQFR